MCRPSLRASGSRFVFVIGVYMVECRLNELHEKSDLDNKRRRIGKKYGKLFVVGDGGSGLFLFCLWAWICPVLCFVSSFLWAVGLLALLGPVWAPVFFLFVARVCTWLFVTHRSFQVIFLQISSAFFAERGCTRRVGE